MHIFIFFTDIKIVLIAVLIITILLIFPLFLNINLIFIKDAKKVFWNINLFGFINVVSGYIYTFEKGIVIIYGKKQKILYYLDLFDIGKSIKPFYDYHFIKIISLTEIGSNNILIPASIGFLIQYINWFICDFFKYKKPQLKIKNDVNVYEGENIFNVYLKARIIFNMLMVVISIIKIVTEKILYAKKIRKQN